MYKRTIILMSSTLAACVAVIALLWLLGGGLSASAAPISNAPAAELQVCPSGCSYSSVQAAVDAAGPGDVIKVAQGTYTDIHIRAGITQVVYISKTVTIQGGYTTTNWTTPDPVAQPTTLDAQGQGRVLYITGDISPTIEGLRITGGNATGLGGSWRGDVGGGIYVNIATAVISDNLIYSNTGHCGGGLYMESSLATLSGNSIYSNTAANVGGGLCLDRSPITLSGSAIYSNTAGSGGGLNLAWSDANLSDNVISGNHAWRGGGLQLWNSEPYIINTVVADNQANTAGSGLYVEAASSPHLLHTTIARNSGGDGSGIYITDNGCGEYSTVAMTNTIIFSHTVGITVTAGNTATLNATLWHANGTDYGGNVIHTNDHSGDPGFKSDGYHLTPGSAAIDQGVNAGVTTDIDGDARPIGVAYDIGADETAAQYFVYLPLVLR